MYGSELEPEIKLIPQFLDPGSVLLDVGANTGIYSITAARSLAGTGAVIALEPNVEMAFMLTKNVQANGFRNVRVRVLCAGAQTTTSDFWSNFDKPNSYSMERRDPRSECESVLQVRIDDLVSWEEIHRLDFIKIDAEGSEASVLAGAEQALRRFRPVVLYEISVADVIKEFDAYRCFQLPGSPNRLLVPHERAVPTWIEAHEHF